MSAFIRTTIVVALALILSQGSALATGSSASVSVHVVVNQTVQLSLPADASAATPSQPFWRSYARLRLSSCAGSPAVVVQTPEAATPDVLYTAVPR